MAFEDSGVGADFIRRFWRALEVPDSMLDLFVVVDPRWDAGGKRLLVSPALERDPEAWDKVALVILVCRRWVGWSETRCARFGRAGRFFLRSLATGIDEAVAQCFADESCSNYNLGGYRQCRAAPWWRSFARPRLFNHTRMHDARPRRRKRWGTEPKSLWVGGMRGDMC